MSAVAPSVTTWVVVLLLAFMSALTTLVGVALAILLGKNARLIALGIGFSAGIMLVISAAELVPTSLREAGAAGTWIGLGLGAAIIGALHLLVPHVHLFEERGLLGGASSRTSTLVTAGFVLHDFPEGIAMANAYIDAPSRGIVVALAIALHNIPEEFAMALPAVATRRRWLLFAVAFVSAMAEPAGAAIGLALAQTAPSFNAFAMAVAAGAMILVSIHELLPMASRFGHLRMFVLGAAASVIVYLGLRWLVPA